MHRWPGLEFFHDWRSILGHSDIVPTSAITPSRDVIKVRLYQPVKINNWFGRLASILTPTEAGVNKIFCTCKIHNRVEANCVVIVQSSFSADLYCLNIYGVVNPQINLVDMLWDLVKSIGQQHQTLLMCTGSLLEYADWQLWTFATSGSC